ncbi:hypothetical protein IHE44_0015039, partial [Lamprotornis superbus]
EKLELVERGRVVFSIFGRGSHPRHFSSDEPSSAMEVEVPEGKVKPPQLAHGPSPNLATSEAESPGWKVRTWLGKGTKLREAGEKVQTWALIRSIRNFNTELFKTSKTKNHLKRIFQLCANHSPSFLSRSSGTKSSRPFPLGSGQPGSVDSWLGWFSSRVLAVKVGEGISVLLLTDKLMLPCSGCVAVMSPGLAVVEACSPSASESATGVVGMKASSSSVAWAPVYPDQLENSKPWSSLMELCFPGLGPQSQESFRRDAQPCSAYSENKLSQGTPAGAT